MQALGVPRASTGEITAFYAANSTDPSSTRVRFTLIPALFADFQRLSPSRDERTALYAGLDAKCFWDSSLFIFRAVASLESHYSPISQNGRKLSNPQRPLIHRIPVTYTFRQPQTLLKPSSYRLFRSISRNKQL
ncbi:hypothetical protein D3C84_816600 [compost metagenome]